MPVNRVRRLAGIAAMAPLLLSGCDNNVLDPFDEVAGTYQLTVFAGASLPATFTCAPDECTSMPNGGTITAEAGTIELHNNGRFVETNHFTLRPTGEPTRSDTFSSIGTYSVSGNDISFSAPPQNNNNSRFMDGTIEFDTIRYVENNESYEYRR